MSLANEIAAVVSNAFFLQFFTAAGTTRAPANTDGQQSVAAVLATGPARGDPLPEHRSVRYGAQGTKTNKQHHRPSNIHHLPSPVPHPHHHHHSSCQPPPTTFLQVLDHPHSKLGVGGQAPTPPSYLEVAGTNPVHSNQKRGVGPGPRPAKTRHSQHQRTRQPRDTAIAHAVALRIPDCNRPRPQRLDIWQRARRAW
jgi:hypothetical protein